MKPSLVRLVVFLTMAVVVIVGCRSLYDGAADGSANLPSTTDSSESSTDAFSSAAGFFPSDSHDVPGGTPIQVEDVTSEEGEETFSHFRAIQIDPQYETSAGPKFVMPFDIDNDGLVDLLTGWNESQPVQIHLQRRDDDGNVYFVSATLGGTGPIAVIGDLDMTDFNGDGWLDVAVLVKETGTVGLCPTADEELFEVLESGMGEVQILFSPGNADEITDGDAWQEVRLERSQLPVRRDINLDQARTYPDRNGYTGLAVGEIDGINGPDIVVAFNPSVCDYYGDDPDPINRIVLYANPGAGNMYEPGGIPLSVTARAGGFAEVNTNGGEVILDGSDSYSMMGWSGYGPVYGEVNYQWTQVAGTAVTLTGAYSAQATFSAPATATNLTFILKVSSGSTFDLGGADAVDFDYVNVIIGSGTNLPPTVTTDAEQTVVPNLGASGAIMVELSAYASDPDGDPLSYSWTQVAGTPVSLANATTATPSFNAPGTGTELRFRVAVSDGTFTVSGLAVVTSGMWAPIVLEGDFPTAGDVEISDVDLDGDNDVIYTYPDRMTANISWARNPVDVVGAKETLTPSNWELRPVGQVNTDANVIVIGDIDMDGFDDVLVRSTSGGVVQWFRHPGAADLEPIFPPPDAVPDRFNFPWQVYTISEYPHEQGTPAGIAIGDLTGDGTNEVIVAVGGVVYWYGSDLAESKYDLWAENFVVDDTKANGATDDPTDPDFEDTGTVIFGLSVTDINGDGFGDIMATFDRRIDSGLTDDTLLWFRNSLSDVALGTSTEEP